MTDDPLDSHDAAGVSLLLRTLYEGQPERARAIAAQRRRPLDVFEAAALGDATRLHLVLAEAPERARALNSDGFSALGLAAFFAQPACARALVDAGAPIDEPSRNAMRVTPLHSAVASRQHEIVAWLLERGADPNARQHGGFTPVHAAAQHGDVALLRLLLGHGADRSARTDDGASAADLARARGHLEVLAWLA